MTFLSNLGFETAQGGGGPGDAAAWSVAVVSTAVALALYNPTPSTSPQTSRETFEIGWESNASYTFEFDDPITQLSSATYATVLPATKFTEDFEELWASNEGYVFDLVLLEQASYLIGGATYQGVDDFEYQWVSSYAFNIDIPSPVAALYVVDAGTAPAEGFGEQWFGGTTYLYALGSTSAASYDTAPESFEDFEEDWPTVVMTTV